MTRIVSVTFETEPVGGYVTVPNEVSRFLGLRVGGEIEARLYIEGKAIEQKTRLRSGGRLDRIDALGPAVHPILVTVWAGDLLEAEASVGNFDGTGVEDGVPIEIVELIRHRSSGAVADVALTLARRLASREGLELRMQKSKNDPWYFQVRTPRFRQVLAYVNPKPTHVRIDYRLPKEHEMGGRAVSRDNFYGIGLNVQSESDVDFAMELIEDALARSD